MKVNLFILITASSLFSIRLTAQREFNVEQGAGPPRINITLEYFPADRFDSAFVVNNKIREISVTESFVENDTLVYDQPYLIYRFNDKGRRIHTETNSWTNHGGARRYTDDYGDSIISVQHEHYKFPDSTSRDSKYIYKFYRINDTLSRSITYNYSFDTLIQKNDMGVFDSKAHWRERQRKLSDEAAGGSHGNLPVIQSIARDKIECIIPPLHPVSPPQPRPIVTRDSLGRTTEIYSTTFIQLNAQWLQCPYQTVVITYHKNEDIIKSMISYTHLDLEKFKAVLDTTEADKRPVFPRCFDLECSFYRLTAGGFELNIPSHITLNRFLGANVWEYKATIKYR